MTRADARAIVAMEVLVKQDRIAPMRIALNFSALPYTGEEHTRENRDDITVNLPY